MPDPDIGLNTSSDCFPYGDLDILYFRYYYSQRALPNLCTYCSSIEDVTQLWLPTILRVEISEEENFVNRGKD